MGKLIWIQTSKEEKPFVEVEWVSKALCGAFKNAVAFNVQGLQKEMVEVVAVQLRDQAVTPIISSETAIAHRRLLGGVVLLPYGCSVKGVEAQKGVMVFNHNPDVKGEGDRFIESAIKFLNNNAIKTSVN